jgi:GTPase Era involved in 16S rRNA processing
VNHIEISHNPFIVETQFVINGQTPAEGCKLSSYKESRLQVWIENLFDELSSIFNGDTGFKVTFRGVESDYLDVVEAASVAKDKGMTVDVKYEGAQPVETRLDQIHQLMNEAQEHPKFGAYLRENDEVSKSFKDSFNRDFDVYVVATMSAGKSTLINAMLGYDLLPARNEATTATIARISDNDKMNGRFSAKRIGENGKVVDGTDEATLKTIEKWNSLEDTQRIDIEGNILAIKERDSVRLVLTDTPGPNNSQNGDHERTTMGFIQDSRRNPLILYVLNGSQLATKDDCNLLRLVAETMRKGGKQSKDRFIFVVNKIDAFDPEKGEYLPSVLLRVQKYLAANGIQNPLIYPVSADLTRLIRKSSDQHTRKERNDYKGMADLFSEDPSMNLLQYMPITSRVRCALEGKKYSPLLLSSGLPAVEAMIDEYIDKYNLPHRVKRAYDALRKAIEIGLNEVHLNEQLDQDERALTRIKEEIKALQKRQEKGFDTTAYKDKIEREGRTLPEEAEQNLHRLGVENKTLFLTIEGEFQESTKIEKANLKLQEAEAKLRFHFNTLINEYESTFVKSQESITQDLNAEYQRYVRDLFHDCEHLELPILEGVRQSVTNIPLNLTVQQQDIKSRKILIDSREVSTSRWFKPWSWGDTKIENLYGDEQYVDLAEFWGQRKGLVKGEFEQLTKSARGKIYEGKDTLIEQYLAFVSREFDEKFTELLNSIRVKLTDRKAREQALEEAKQLLDWINAFKGKLEKTLAV